MQEFENAINEPATQLIGVIQKEKWIASVLSGDELEVNTVIGVSFPSSMKKEQIFPPVK